MDGSLRRKLLVSVKLLRESRAGFEEIQMDGSLRRKLLVSVKLLRESRAGFEEI